MPITELDAAGMPSGPARPTPLQKPATKRLPVKRNPPKKP